ncbi:hypothetical protein AAHD62_06355 [Enterobacter hormaechei]
MTINKAFSPTGLGGAHPANGPLSVERMIRVRDELQRTLEYSEGSNLNYMVADAVKMIDELLARRSGSVVPDGWVAVPVEPTPEMLAEICLVEGWTERALQARYRAMLAAAPQKETN